MTKIALINDIHFGCRNDSDLFLDFAEDFFKDIFFPTIDELGIKTVINLGDTFDRRKYINYKTLKKAKEVFFDPMVQRGIMSPTLVGNHDTFFKNTNKTNSIDLVLKEYHFYNNIHCITGPEVIDIHGVNICMIPWICPENEKESMKVMAEAKTDLCMGHFAIQGFVMHSGQVAEEGLPIQLFDKFDMVLSGHFHHRSSNGKIYYLGNPYEMTWQDYGDTKGFHIFDTSTRELTFMDNPYQMFHRIVYNDDNVNPWTSMINYDRFTNAYVKVVVQKKAHPQIFEKFMEGVYAASPFSINIVSNFLEVIEAAVEQIDQSDDTLTIMTKYVKRMYEANPVFDLAGITQLLTNTYQQACNEDNS